MPSPIPAFLGPYRVESILGQGGMGTVYRARHSKTEEEVAVKVIADSIANQERFRRRFDAEVETLIRLSHRHIVRIIGCGEQDGRLFYSMEFVDGESLQQRLRQVKQFGWEEVINYASQIVSALKHAHDFGVIHRDLKPANLLVDRKNQIKITDFGIAKLYGASEETALGSVMGTADFMPPEQAEAGRITPRTDLYALGAVMYCLLCGHSPHAAASLPETLYNIRYKQPVSLQSILPDCPKELDTLILELLEKNPSDRPPTAVVVSNRLAAMQAGLRRMSQPTRESEEASDLTFMTDPQRTSAHRNEPTVTADSPRTGGPPVTLASEAALASAHLDFTTEVGTIVKPEVLESEEQRRTHYTDLRDTPPPTPTFAAPLPAEHGNHWFSIAATAGLLIACIAAIAWGLRTPPADDLYEAARLAIDDEASQSEIEARIEEFRAAYPSDPRLEEFEPILSEMQMQRVINRLQRRSAVGSQPSTPLQLAVANALNISRRDPYEAMERLEAIKTVFADPATLDDEEKELMAIVDAELTRLRQNAADLPNAAEEFLADQFAAIADATEQERREFYEAVLTTYREEPQAKRAVAKAEAALNLLNEPAAKTP